MVRSMLQSRGHQDNKWCFAYSCYAIWLLRRLLNRHVFKTPYEAWHNKKPSFKDMLMFGSVVYILNATMSRQVLDARTMIDLRKILNENDVDGYFMLGYANTTKVIIYWDPKTNIIKRSHHCFVDEFETRICPHQRHTPGALLLAEAPGGHYDPTPPSPQMKSDFKFHHLIFKNHHSLLMKCIHFRFRYLLKVVVFIFKLEMIKNIIYLS
eukprot:scaffold8800_cov58-Attheya_sp.AAC.4